MDWSCRDGCLTHRYRDGGLAEREPAVVARHHAMGEHFEATVPQAFGKVLNLKCGFMGQRPTLERNIWVLAPFAPFTAGLMAPPRTIKNATSPTINPILHLAAIRKKAIA